MNRNWHPYSKSNNIPITELYDILERMPSSQPELYGYPIEHLEMIARVMEKENCTPEAVAQMLQNAGKVAKMVRDKMMEMLNESIEKSCKGEANE
jgi:ABC-type proline/glycine betaine transport system substrate-binding protein